METETNTTEEDARPNFNELFKSPAARAMVEMAYNAHLEYEAAHAARYGVESVGLKAWKAELPDFAPESDEDASTVSAFDLLSDRARLSENPSEVLAILNFATDLLADAKANLNGLHAVSRKLGNVKVDANADVPAMRDTLDSLIAACKNLAATPVLDADTFWSLFPTRIATAKNGSKRTEYNGPKIPQTRTMQPIRANSKQINIEIKLEDADTDTDTEVWSAIGATMGDLQTQAKRLLRLDMSELREAVGGEFSEAILDQPFDVKVTTKSADGTESTVDVTARLVQNG